MAYRYEVPPCLWRFWSHPEGYDFGFLPDQPIYDLVKVYDALVIEPGYNRTTNEWYEGVIHFKCEADAVEFRLSIDGHLADWDASRP